MTSSGWADLAAVSAALPRALRPWADVRVCCPAIATSSNNSPILKSLANARPRRRCRPARLGRASTRDGLPVYVLLCPQLYDRPGNPYGDEDGRDWPDNDIRFARFASAAAELAMGTLDKNWAADLVHANDWQAALVPAYLAWSGARLPSILTIHNLAYQGLFPRETLRRIGAPESSFHIDGARVLRQAVLPQGRPRLRLASDHGQRDLCQGDHHARARLRTRRPASHALRRLGADGHPERHRRELGSALLRPAGTAIRRRRLGRQAAPMPIMSASSSGLRYRAGRSSVWSRGWFIRRASISCCRPPTRSSRPAGRSSSPVSGEPAIEQALVDGASAPARRDRRGDRLQRRAGAADFRRQRLYADAVALRAVRPEPDVCATLRLAADRPPDRRAGRNHHRRRDRLPVLATLDRDPSSAASGAPSRPSSSKDRLDAMRRSAMARSFSWDLSAACYSALYRKTVAP